MEAILKKMAIFIKGNASCLVENLIVGFFLGNALHPNVFHVNFENRSFVYFQNLVKRACSDIFYVSFENRSFVDYQNLRERNVFFVMRMCITISSVFTKLHV